MNNKAISTYAMDHSSSSSDLFNQGFNSGRQAGHNESTLKTSSAPTPHVASKEEFYNFFHENSDASEEKIDDAWEKYKKRNPQPRSNWLWLVCNCNLL